MWKWIGLTVGLLFKGPLGAVLGFAAGWWLDSNISRIMAGEGFNVFNGGHAQTVFQRALFGALGHLAKADGRVTRQEISIAEQLMAQLHLSKRQREEAISNFRLGKSASYPLESELNPFKVLTRNQPHLRRMFVEILLNGAMADGIISSSERQILERVARTLGMTAEQLNQMIGQRSSYRPGPEADRQPNPYQVLGIDRNASEKQIKQAYRRLMSRYHPDKMAGQKVPAKMREYAHDKVREVRAAYDQIRKQRDFR